MGTCVTRQVAGILAYVGASVPEPTGQDEIYILDQ